MKTNQPPSAEDQPVIEITQLTKKFGNREVLRDVSLTIPRGQVFGLLGRNGAGKTTLLKHLLGTVKPSQGSVRVFGLDPMLNQTAVLAKLGFLSEDRDLPMWMRVDQLLRYTSAFYPNWDAGYALEWLSRFKLDARAKVKHLSRGELAKLGLLCALSHHPELLILDEPSSGLDPLVRKEILESLLLSVAEQGRTVLFSSHLLDEVERVSDRIGIIRDGELVLCGETTELMEQHVRFTLRFPAPRGQCPPLENAMSLEGNGLEWSGVYHGNRDGLAAQAALHGGELVQVRQATLEEVFQARMAVSGSFKS